MRTGGGWGALGTFLRKPGRQPALCSAEIKSFDTFPFVPSPDQQHFADHICCGHNYSDQLWRTLMNGHTSIEPHREREKNFNPNADGGRNEVEDSAINKMETNFPLVSSCSVNKRGRTRVEEGVIVASLVLLLLLHRAPNVIQLHYDDAPLCPSAS